jgi:hypothetical protein
MLVSQSSGKSSAQTYSQLLSELARRVEWLCRSCPEEMRGAAAYEALVQFKPLVQEAIEALDDIKERRDLTEDEQAWRGALRLLVGAQS